MSYFYKNKNKKRQAIFVKFMESPKQILVSGFTVKEKRSFTISVLRKFISSILNGFYAFLFLHLIRIFPGKFISLLSNCEISDQKQIVEF